MKICDLFTAGGLMSASLGRSTVKGIRIRPEKNGLRVTLFDLQADVMEVIWSHGWGTFTVADVHAAMEKTREIAYTTVMTTIHRLFEMELLGREKDGKRHQYHPLMTRETFNRETARDVLLSLPDSGHEAAIALLIDQVGEADLDELDRLEAMIQNRRRELSK